MGMRRSGVVGILILTSLGFFMSMMDSMIVTTASTAIRADFNISVSTLQWTLNAYNITIAAVLLVGVALGERFGRRKVYTLGILIFTLGSVLCALATNITMLVIARMIEGIGASVMTPMSMAILTNALPVEIRGKALGIWSGIGGLALIVGPSLGGLIVAKLAWQWIFWINVPIGVVAIICSYKMLPESVGNGDEINLVDAILIIASLSGIVWALSELTATKLTMVALLVGGISLLLGGLFIGRQASSEHPMLPLVYFKSVTFTVGNIATFLLYAAMYGVVFFLPQFLQTAGSNPLRAGLEILPWTGTLVVAAPFAGKAVDQFGEKAIAMWGLLLQGVGYALITLLVTTKSAYVVMVLPLVIAGVGLSMAGPALQKAVLGAVERSAIGKASGIYNVFRLLGGAVGTTISVFIFYQFGSVASKAIFMAGFRAVMLAAALLSVMGVPLAYRIKTR